MENNRFHQHRLDIGKISKEQNVDIGVAANILAREKEWSDFGEESMAFYRFVNDMDPREREKYFSE